MDKNTFFLIEGGDYMLSEDYLIEAEVVKSVKSGAKKIDNIGKEVIVAIRKLHTTDEEYLAKGIPQLSKLITRGVIVAATCFIPVVGPLLGLITFFTSHALKKKFTDQERARLKGMYEQKLKFIEVKMEKAKEDKDSRTFSSLARIEGRLKADSKRLVSVKPDHTEIKKDED